MTLEQPRLGSDPPNGSGRERGATCPQLQNTYNIMHISKFTYNLILITEFSYSIILITSFHISRRSSKQSKTDYLCFLIVHYSYSYHINVSHIILFRYFSYKCLHV